MATCRVVKAAATAGCMLQPNAQEAMPGIVLAALLAVWVEAASDTTFYSKGRCIVLVRQLRASMGLLGLDLVVEGC
jgi:hypothetical protein